MPRPPLKITSADNPRIKSTLKLRDRKDRVAAGRFVAEGDREITRAIDAGLTPIEFFVSSDLVGKDPHAALADLGLSPQIIDQCQVYDLPGHLLAKLAYHERPEGIVAVFELPTRTLESLLPPADKPGLYLVAVGIEKPGNLGALARTCAGAGAHGLIVADGVVDAFNPNAIRASTGAVFSLPIVSGTHAQVLGWLTKNNIALFVSTPSDAADYTRCNMTGPIALAIGAEDQGLDDAWLNAGTRIKIPMANGPVDSLNASVAGALLLYEAVRQRA